MLRTGVGNIVLINRRYLWKIEGLKHCTGTWKRGIWNSSTKSLPGYETYQLSPEVGMKHSEILTGLDLEQRMSIQFRSMIYKPRRMICNPKST